MPVEFVSAIHKPDLLRPLFDAYSAMLYQVDEGMRACLANQNYDEELSHLAQKYAPEMGGIYVILYDGEVAGMGALTRLAADCGELKRIFLYPEFRGKGLGLALMERLLQDAHRIGYRHLRLDTFPAMTAALGLYEKLGFYLIPRYNDNPLTRAIFYQKDLQEESPMETKKLYYDDAFMRQFDAKVISCQQEKKNYLVVLDQTAFYPEGGGQPADFGTLGEAKVSDVHEKDGVIVHTCSKALAVGETVHGEIDWARRFDHMQQHSGEHIVSGMLCSAFHCDNVGFHMGSDSVVIDYNAEIPWEGVLEIEAKANQYIWENHDFVVQWPTAEELKALPYRSKKELTGAVRITSFPGADMCACCGTHVDKSGQVGLVKFIGWQKFRDGVRLELLCGKRALDYLAINWQQNHAIAQKLSVKPHATLSAVDRLTGELEEVKDRCAAMEDASFTRIAEENRSKGDVLLIESAMSPDSARRLCDSVSRTCGGRCAVFAGEDGSYKYAVIHPGQDIRDFIKSMNTALNGRGGGRDGFAQGSVSCTEEAIRKFFA